jgi:hypothetical protein
MPFDLATAKPVEPESFDLASAQPVEAAAPERSLPEKIIRGVGRTVRAGVRGITAVPNMIGDALGLQSSETVRNALTKMGLPEAMNPTERIAEDVASGMAGAGPFVKGGELAARGATALTRKIGEMLATRPGAQIVSGATGGGAAGTVREKGGGPGAQLAAGLAGAFVPALPAAAAAATRRVVRGGEAGRQRVADNIAAFEEAGAGTPTVGQATEKRGNQALESTLSRTPGGAGPMVAKAEAEAAGIGSKIDDMAGALAPETGAEPAGRAIKSGVEQHVQGFKEASGKLYDKVDALIHPESPVEVSNTQKYLADATKVNPNAKATSAQLVNPKLVAIKEALDADLGAGAVTIGGKQVPADSPLAKAAGVTLGSALPYETLKRLRSQIGAMMDPTALTSDVPHAELKKLYGSLTKDMAAAAKKAGPDAEAALVQANNHYRQGMQHIEDVLQPIVNKADPEKMFLAAVSGTKEGATTISGVMKSLPEESQKIVAGTMLKRLGTALPGKQNELGEVFSTETFLTNWNKLHPDAKRVMFAPLSAGMRSDLDKIAKVASNVREGSKVFANPSGTAQASIAAAQGWGTVGAAILALSQGQVGTAAAVTGASIGTALSANTLAKAFTNPKVIHWLAESTKVPVEQAPIQLNQLFQQSLYMRGDERKEVRAFVKEVRAGLQQQAAQNKQAKVVPQ